MTHPDIVMWGLSYPITYPAANKKGKLGSYQIFLCGNTFLYLHN